VTKYFGCGFILLLCFGVGIAKADTITLTVLPQSQTADIGDTVTELVRIAHLRPNTLSTFDVDIVFQPLVLQFASLAFGDPVTGDQLDPSKLGVITKIQNAPGHLQAVELSLNNPDALDDFQRGSFVLFVATFDVVALGTSPITPTIKVLGNSIGNPLHATVNPGQVIVTSITIPEPPTALLTTCGLAALMLMLTRRRSLFPSRPRRFGQPADWWC
jgi:hypothetical protein